jgi:hypothetical protein
MGASSNIDQPRNEAAGTVMIFLKDVMRVVSVFCSSRFLKVARSRNYSRWIYNTAVWD